MTENVRHQTEEEWKKAEAQLEKYYEAHEDLKELLDMSGIDLADRIDEKARGIHE